MGDVPLVGCHVCAWCRVYCDPQSCHRWVECQRLLGPKVVVAALQLYSDKTLLDNKQRYIYPLRATLLNIAHCKRVNSLR